MLHTHSSQAILMCRNPVSFLKEDEDKDVVVVMMMMMM
jgi:mannitol/fructose-specific phosphotransferase system IIA component (Ntr-type)